MTLLTAAGITPDTAGTNFNQVLQALFALPGKNVVRFTSSGTWTVPANVSIVDVELWAAGGGSGGTWGSATSAVGGGAGAYARGLVSVTPGGTITVTVGTGGTAGASASTPGNGGNGGPSSFGSSITATGGAGGGGSNSGLAAGVAAGGTATGGTLNVAGGTSGGAFVLTSPTVVISQGGVSFGTPPTHLGANPASAGGIAGYFPGGGASGSINQAAGAVGGAGLVIIRY